MTEHCSAACRTERVIVVGGVGTRQGVVERVYHDHAESEAQLRDRVAELEAAAADGWRTKGLRPPGVVRTGPFAIDLYADTLTVAGAPLELAPGEWDLLVVLAWHLGRYVAPGELMGRLWPRSRRNGSNADGRVASYHAVRGCVARLRSALGEYGALVETEPGRGYRLRSLPVVV